MRNLKKILALVLVLVMAMSFAGAAYADADDIKNVEAVAVMSGVGIFNGIDGEFQPNGNLTREQAAKIISYMLLGKKVADALPNDTEPFADVEAGRWSSGSIAYCASLGIVSGRGEGKFDPTANVTGYEFGKMVMVAAGINGNFTGTGYEFAVATALAQNKLLADLEGVILSQPMTREQACQLAFNGLLYAAEERENGKYEIEYSGSDDVLAAVVAKMQFNSYVDAIVAANALEIAKVDYKIVPATVKGNDLHDFVEYKATNDFGVVTTGWSSQNGKTVYFSVEEEPIYTVANKTISAADLHAIFGVKEKETKVIDVYTNSKTANGSIKAEEKGTATVGGNGIVTYVYKTKVVEVVTTFTTVEKVVEAVKPSAENPKGVPAYVVLANGLEIETESYKEGDALLVTVAEGKVQSHELAEAVVGTVNRFNAKSVTVNGTAYNWAASAADTSVPGDAWKTAYVYFTDGVNLYAIDEVKNAPAAAPEADGYAYVTGWQFAFDGGKGHAGDLFNDKVEAVSTAAAKAVIVNLDGTTEVVDLAVSYNKETKQYSVKGVDGKAVVITEDNDDVLVALNTWVAYELVDGEYNFLGMVGAAVENITVNKNNTLEDGRLLTSKTTYTNINIHEKNQKVTTVTGYKNIVVDGEALVFTNAKSGVVTAIYNVTSNGPAAAETKANYAYAVKAGDTVANGTEWSFYINGKTEPAVVVAPGVEIVAGTVYDLTLTDGVVTAAAPVAAIDPEAAVKVTLVDDEYFVAGSVYTFAKNIAVYNLKTGAVDSIEEGAKVVVAVANEGAAVLVYVVD